ncbi:tyrosine-type recombinase/integrase [Consotaella aegiceratis]|uniref:tyrosine-type recombinase/integrase n=1 Tax=Consotaella aegiceratis TaxID=3097961 RepID=UPI002F401BC6
MRNQEALEAFVFHCEVERNLAGYTVRSYRCDLKDFFSYSPVRDVEDCLSVRVLKGYLAHMVEADRPLSAATVRRRFATLRGFARFAAKTYGLKDPFHDWGPAIKRARRLPRAISADEVRTLIADDRGATSTDVETTFAVLLISATGLRVSELCSIRRQDIAADGSAIHICGKGARDRVVYISDPSLKREIVRRKLAGRYTNDFLLVNGRGTRLDPQSLRRRLHKLHASRGIDRNITPHMLRHTAATLLIEQGTDIRFVQRLLGHASIATTEIYTHVTDVALKRAITEANVVDLLTSGATREERSTLRATTTA